MCEYSVHKRMYYRSVTQCVSRCKHTVVPGLWFPEPHYAAWPSFMYECYACSSPRIPGHHLEVPQGGQWVLVVSQGGQRVVEVPQGGQRVLVVSQGVQRVVKVPQGGQRVLLVAQGGQRVVEVPQGGQWV